MLQPVGNLPPAVYWRRRLIFVVVPGVLVLLLLWAWLGAGGGNSKQNASTTGRPSTPPPAVSTRSTSAALTSTSATRSAAAGGGKACPLDSLQIQASTGMPAYAVNSRPDLYLVVTNVSARPCRFDLADRQIELRVFTGDVRVWGSHDCQIQPGTEVATLAPRKPVRRGIVWSGQTSAPGCSGTRLVAQAGTYKLVASLSGKQSPPIAFKITS